jgi:hypothetical protein
MNYSPQKFVHLLSKRTSEVNDFGLKFEFDPFDDYKFGNLTYTGEKDSSHVFELSYQNAIETKNGRGLLEIILQVRMDYKMMWVTKT